jgi:hypothetical protein
LCAVRLSLDFNFSKKLAFALPMRSKAIGHQ